MRLNYQQEQVEISHYQQWVCDAEEALRYVQTLKDQGYTKIVIVPIERKVK